MLRERGAELRMYVGVLACALAVGLVFPRHGPETYDSDIMLQVTESFLHDGNFLVHRDTAGLNTPYSVYGIGMSLLMAAPYWFAERFRGDPVHLAMEVNAWVFAAIVLCGVAFARLSGLARGQSMAVGVLVALGTNLLPYTATAFSEPGVALGVALGLLGILAASKRLPWGAPLAGAGSGLALLMRTDSLLLVVPVLALGVWLLAARKITSAAWFSVAFLPFFVGWAAYNDLRYGAPWRLGYEDNPFNHDVFKGVAGLLVSPGRGLFLYVPLAIVALVLMVKGWRTAPALTGIALLLLVIRIAFYAPWWAWNGGWCFGPRFLVPAMPALVVGFVALVRRLPAWPRAGRIGVAVLFALSVVVQLGGAAVGYERSHLTLDGLKKAHWDPGTPRAVSIENQEIIDRALFDWSLFAIPDHVTKMVAGEDLAGKLFHAPIRVRRIVLLIAAFAVGLVLCLSALRGRRDDLLADQVEADADGRYRRVATSSRNVS